MALTLPSAAATVNVNGAGDKIPRITLNSLLAVECWLICCGDCSPDCSCRRLGCRPNGPHAVQVFEAGTRSVHRAIDLHRQQQIDITYQLAACREPTGCRRADFWSRLARAATIRNITARQSGIDSIYDACGRANVQFIDLPSSVIVTVPAVDGQKSGVKADFELQLTSSLGVSMQVVSISSAVLISILCNR